MQISGCSNIDSGHFAGSSSDMSSIPSPEPLLSIIVVAHNAASTLALSLDSVVNQKNVLPDDIQIILVNDSSGDDTETIGLRYAERYQVVYSAVGFKCVGQTRNHGISIANGRFVTFLDADDLIVPGSLEVLLSGLRKYDPDIVVTHLREFHGEAPVVSEESGKAGFLTIECSEMVRQFLIHRDVQGHLIGKVFRRSLFDVVAIPPLHCYEDLAVLPSLLKISSKCLKFCGVIYLYRKQKGSLSDRVDWARLNSFIFALEKIDQEFPEQKYQSLRDALWVKLGSDLWSSQREDLMDSIRVRMNEIRIIPFFLSPSVRVSRKKMLLSMLIQKAWLRNG